MCVDYLHYLKTYQPMSVLANGNTARTQVMRVNLMYAGSLLGGSPHLKFVYKHNNTDWIN